MAREPGAARRYDRILLIKPSSLGDVVHALPVLAALRRRYPHAHIAWLIGASFAPLLDGHPLLSEIIPFDRRRFGRMLQQADALDEFGRFVCDLRAREFDLVIDLQGLVRSGFLAWASGAGRRIGFADAREFAWLFYTDRVACPADMHAVDKNLRVLAALGIDNAPAEFPLALDGRQRSAARELLCRAAGRELGAFIAIVPGARWPSKIWPAGRFVELINRMGAEGDWPPAVLLGGPDERALADEIVAGTSQAVIDLVGRTSLRELAALLAEAQLVVCCDSGPMHIAAALDRPTAAVFGPTSPALTGPYSSRARTVSLPLPCAPCHERLCPLGHHACLRDLEVAVVLSAMSALRDR
ncbi:Lipopolysaccharide heptosyltransferase 1 [Phycisphaerae bacterium RAS1]|nr:Lipopolysaccharide heptosyltransferase 1 [Phycisphaerae bacterium RAS1]